ncbi:MAG: sensor domain-containing diguanylate cyclase [Thermoleophilaceae bacterium]|nr:sensor domain-containing diguanylate cyclase [Thermoleophilaceae bacterium]
MRLFGVARDVTELTEMRAALQARSEQLDIAQSLARLGSWEWDAATDVVAWSDELFRIFGLDRDNAPATFETYLSAVHPDDRERLKAAVGAAQETMSSFELQHRIIRGDGEERTLDCRGSAVPGGSRRMVGVCQDVTEQQRREDDLRHRADHDALTGLLARHRFEREVDRQLGLNARYGGSCATLVMDVDGFKQVNDTGGHSAGDLVLTGLADVLTGRLRETDVTARLGGDEFAVLLPSANGEQAAQLAGSLLDAIRDTGVTVSIGVAVAEGDGHDANEITGRADIAMYEAKKSGRDRVASS